MTTYRLQWRSKALTLPNNLWLFLTFTNTYIYNDKDKDMSYIPLDNIMRETFHETTSWETYTLYLYINIICFTCVLFFTLCHKTDNGPLLKSSASSGFLSSILYGCVWKAKEDIMLIIIIIIYHHSWIHTRVSTTSFPSPIERARMCVSPSVAKRMRMKGSNKRRTRSW